MIQRTQHNFEHLRGIYFGERGHNFKILIQKILKNSKLSQDCINIILQDKNMKMLGDAFTSDTADQDNNYQIYEQLGDLSANKFIVMYMYQRFPQLRNARCVKIVARLRINYGAKKSFAEIARKLGFWNFITANIECRQKKMKALLEDVFESFLGVIELIVDDNSNMLVSGFSVIYKILKTIFDDIDISLDYNDLYDPKTRLKELFDLHQDLGPLIYEDKRNEQTNIVCSKVYRIDNIQYMINPKTGLQNKKKIISCNKIFLGTGYASLKQDAQQFAAASAIKHLNDKGYFKPIDEIYNSFKKNDNVIKEWKSGLNAKYFTKYRSKYCKHWETPLHYYSKNADIKMIDYCLKNGSLLNIDDSNGLFPFDYIITKHYLNFEKLNDLLHLFRNVSQNIFINSSIYDLYVKNKSKLKLELQKFNNIFLITYHHKKKIIKNK
jgi:dsRNA-specific ribonuclease